MAKVDATVDSDQSDIHTEFVECPHCGIKLTDLELVSGFVKMRFRCRRCKRYIVVRILG